MIEARELIAEAEQKLQVQFNHDQDLIDLVQYSLNVGFNEGYKTGFKDVNKLKLRQLIIELGKKGALDHSERSEAVVEEICKRENITL